MNHYCSPIEKTLDCSKNVDAPLFEIMSQNLNAQGYSILKNALPIALGFSLWKEFHNNPSPKFQRAGVSRDNEFNLNSSVRTDETVWIESNTTAGHVWNAWMALLQAFLNAQLFLGYFHLKAILRATCPEGFIGDTTSC